MGSLAGEHGKMLEGSGGISCIGSLGDGQTGLELDRRLRLVIDIRTSSPNDLFLIGKPLLASKCLFIALGVHTWKRL